MNRGKSYMLIRLPQAARLVLALSAACACLPAADAPSVRKGVMELGAFAGANFAPGQNGATFDGFRAMGGGNVTYSYWKYILPYAEYGYFPEIQGSYRPTGATRRIDYTTQIHDFHGGVHLRTEPIPGTKLVPYAVFGFGGVRVNFTGKEYYDNGDIAGLPKESAMLPCVNYGGGLRYYFNENFGIRGEMKGYRPFSGTERLTQSFGKVEFGIFWQKKLR
jgi:hypothetical protein